MIKKINLLIILAQSLILGLGRAGKRRIALDKFAYIYTNLNSNGLIDDYEDPNPLPNNTEEFEIDLGLSASFIQFGIPIAEGWQKFQNSYTGPIHYTFMNFYFNSVQGTNEAHPTFRIKHEIGIFERDLPYYLYPDTPPLAFEDYFDPYNLPPLVTKVQKTLYVKPTMEFLDPSGNVLHTADLATFGYTDPEKTPVVYLSPQWMVGNSIISSKWDAALPWYEYPNTHGRSLGKLRYYIKFRPRDLRVEFRFQSNEGDFLRQKGFVANGFTSKPSVYEPGGNYGRLFNTDMKHPSLDFTKLDQGSIFSDLIRLAFAGFPDFSSIYVYTDTDPTNPPFGSIDRFLRDGAIDLMVAPNANEIFVNNTHAYLYSNFVYIWDMSPTSTVKFDHDFTQFTEFGMKQRGRFDAFLPDAGGSVVTPAMGPFGAKREVPVTFTGYAYTPQLKPHGSQCIGGIPNTCRFIKNVGTNTYSLYVTPNSDGFHLRTQSEGPTIRATLGVPYTGHPIAGAVYGNTMVVYFKYDNSPGAHFCSKTVLFINNGVYVSYSSNQELYLGDSPTGKFLVPGQWYALAHTAYSFPESGSFRFVNRAVFGDLSTNPTTWSELKSMYTETMTNEEFTSRLNVLGGPGCSAELHVKFAISVAIPLYPWSSSFTTDCNPDMPFKIFQRELTAEMDPVKPLNYDSVCLSDRVYPSGPHSSQNKFTNFNPKVDPDIKITRKDESNCPDNWKVQTTASGTTCVCTLGSSAKDDGSCGCPKPQIQYYSKEYWLCDKCLSGTTLSEDGFSCTPTSQIQKVAKNFFHEWDNDNKIIRITFDGLIPGNFLQTGIEIRDYLFISIDGIRFEDDFTVSPTYYSSKNQIELKIFSQKLLEFKEVTYMLFDKQYKFTPEIVEFTTGSDNPENDGLKLIADGVSPEALEASENALLLGSIVFPSFVDKMPFIFTFFSFLRTLNFYPVKLPDNLDGFLRVYYVDYKTTYGWKMLKNMLPEGKNPPVLWVQNRHLSISKILYFSNSIPILSIVSKVALIWYLLKWFRKAKKADSQKLEEELKKEEKKSFITKMLDWLFVKFMSFLMIKVHIYMYSRLIFVFTSFQGFRDVVDYSSFLGWINMFEGLFDLFMILFIEFKIYDFLKFPKTKAQLMMLDIVNIKSILMIDIFKRDSHNRHSAIYLCLMNLHLFFLAATLVVFNQFKELLFACHIGQMLAMLSYTYLHRNNFKKRIDFFIYFMNALGFAGIICLYSLFMYYDEFSPSTSSLIGFVVSIFILMLMVVKIIFFSVKLFRDYRTWKKQKVKPAGKKLDHKSLEKLISCEKLGVINGEGEGPGGKSSKKILVKKKFFKNSKPGSRNNLGKAGEGSLLKFVTKKQAAMKNNTENDYSPASYKEDIENYSSDKNFSRRVVNEQKRKQKMAKAKIKIRRGSVRKSARELRKKLSKRARQRSKISIYKQEIQDSAQQLNNLDSDRVSQADSNSKLSRRQKRKLMSARQSAKFSEIHIDSERESDDDLNGSIGRKLSHKMSRFGKKNNSRLGDSVDLWDSEDQSRSPQEHSQNGGSLRHIQEGNKSRRGSGQVLISDLLNGGSSGRKQRKPNHKTSKFGRRAQKEEFNSSLEVSSQEDQFPATYNKLNFCAKIRLNKSKNGISTGEAGGEDLLKLIDKIKCQDGGNFENWFFFTQNVEILNGKIKRNALKLCWLCQKIVCIVLQRKRTIIE